MEVISYIRDASSAIAVAVPVVYISFEQSTIFQHLLFAARNDLHHIDENSSADVNTLVSILQLSRLISPAMWHPF